MELRFLDLRQVTEEQMARWESWLTPAERAAIRRSREPCPHICGRGLAREMVAELLKIPPEQVAITCTDAGKPVTDGAFFSISHSGAVVACAVSHRPIGLDVEELRAVPPRLGGRLGTGEPETFFACWTAVEARLKCLGGRISRWQEYMTDPEGFTTELVAAPEGYVAAVCE